MSPSNHEHLVSFLDFSSFRKSTVARPHRRPGNVTNDTISVFISSSESGSAPRERMTVNAVAPANVEIMIVRMIALL